MKIKREALASEYITDALLLLMKKKDFRDISITEICEKADVTRMSFYHSFRSKKDVLKKWAEAVTDGFLTEPKISYKADSSREYFVRLFNHMAKYKGHLHGALPRRSASHRKGAVRPRGCRRSPREYDDYKSYFLSSGIYNVFLLWLVNGCEETPDELAARLEDILVK